MNKIQECLVIKNLQNNSYVIPDDTVGGMPYIMASPGEAIRHWSTRNSVVDYANHFPNEPWKLVKLQVFEVEL